MTNEVNLAEAADFFTYALGYPVHVEIVDALQRSTKTIKASSSTDAAPVKRRNDQKSQWWMYIQHLGTADTNGP